MKKFLSEKWQKIIKAISFLLIGLAFIFVPGTALSVTLRIIGTLVLVYEALEIYEIVKANKNSPALALFLVNEIFVAILALMLLINPTGAVKLLSLIVAIYFIVFGAIGLYRSIDSGDTKAIVLNSVTGGIGLLLLVLPYLFADVVTIILGIALIVKGVNLLLPLINNSGDDGDSDTYYI